MKRKLDHQHLLSSLQVYLNEEGMDNPIISKCVVNADGFLVMSGNPLTIQVYSPCYIGGEGWTWMSRSWIEYMREMGEVG